MLLLANRQYKAADAAEIVLRIYGRPMGLDFMANAVARSSLIDETPDRETLRLICRSDARFHRYCRDGYGLDAMNYWQEMRTWFPIQPDSTGEDMMTHQPIDTDLFFTLREAAELVLRTVGQPMHTANILSAIRRSGLCNDCGKDPLKTLYATLASDMKFARTGPAEFALATDLHIKKVHPLNVSANRHGDDLRDQLGDGDGDTNGDGRGGNQGGDDSRLDQLCQGGAESR